MVNEQDSNIVVSLNRFTLTVTFGLILLRKLFFLSYGLNGISTVLR